MNLSDKIEAERYVRKFFVALLKNIAYDFVRFADSTNKEKYNWHQSAKAVLEDPDYRFNFGGELLTFSEMLDLAGWSRTRLQYELYRVKIRKNLLLFNQSLPKGTPRMIAHTSFLNKEKQHLLRKMEPFDSGWRDAPEDLPSPKELLIEMLTDKELTIERTEEIKEIAKEYTGFWQINSNFQLEDHPNYALLAMAERRLHQLRIKIRVALVKKRKAAEKASAETGYGRGFEEKKLHKEKLFVRKKVRERKNYWEKNNPEPLCPTCREEPRLLLPSGKYYAYCVGCKANYLKEYWKSYTAPSRRKNKEK